MKFRGFNGILMGCFLGLLLSGVSLSAVLESVEVSYRDAASLVRLAEYFSDQESERAVMRSDPQVRSGLYFLLSLEKPHRDLPAGMTVEIALITAESPDAVVHTFPFPKQDDNRRRAYIGLTGDAWPADPNRPQPTAWRVRLLDPSGRLVSEKSSFLWGTR